MSGSNREPVAAEYNREYLDELERAYLDATTSGMPLARQVWRLRNAYRAAWRRERLRAPPG